MGSIKFEIDLPEFEKELSINLVIKRDGVVQYCSTSHGQVVTSPSSIIPTATSQTVEGKATPTAEVPLTQQPQVLKPSIKKLGGNLMAAEF